MSAHELARRLKAHKRVERVRYPGLASHPRASCAVAIRVSARTSPHTVLPYGVSSFLPSLGMTNAEAITNVTAFAAEVCGIADRTGTLEPGKEADILAVAGNPLEDITAIHHVVAVFARGDTAIDTRPRPPSDSRPTHSERSSNPQRAES